MADSEAWRSERAEQLFPNKRFGGAPRPLVSAGAARDRFDDVLPMQRPPVRPVAPPQPPEPVPTPRPEQQRVAPAVQPAGARAVPFPLIVGALAVLLLAAALIGWLVGRSRQTSVRPTAIAEQAVPVTAIPASPPPVPPVTAAPVVDTAAIAPAPAVVPVVRTPRPKRIVPVTAEPSRSAARAPREIQTARRPVDRVHAASPTALAGRDFRPSFNCRRATALSNRLICNDPALAALDNRLASAFRARIAGVDLQTARAIDADQTSFLNERIACTSRGCIERVYRDRLAQLAEAR